MPWGNLTGVHLLIVVAVVLVLFGASKLPIFAKGLGQSIKIFRSEINDVKDDIKADRKADEKDEKSDSERDVVYMDKRSTGGAEARRSADDR